MVPWSLEKISAQERQETEEEDENRVRRKDENAPRMPSTMWSTVP